MPLDMGFANAFCRYAPFLIPQTSLTWWTSRPLSTPNHGFPSATVRFAHDWHVLGPFQIGTREAAWSADPLEYYGGFIKLQPDANTTFASAIARTGQVRWSTRKLDGPDAVRTGTIAKLSVSFDKEVDWQFLQQVYGWAATQWQAWARGEIFVDSNTRQTLLLYTDSVLEYAIDGKRVFGGDFFGFRRAPAVLHLAAGRHTIDLRLVRDIRAMGALGLPSVDTTLELVSAAETQLHVGHPLMPDVVNGRFVSPFGSISITNTGQTWVYVSISSAESDVVKIEPISSAANAEMSIAPGQTRPHAFKVTLLDPAATHARLRLSFRDETAATPSAPRTHDVMLRFEHRSIRETHKLTYLHASGIVSYSILRAPSENASCSVNATAAAVLLLLHGAGVDVESSVAKDALTALPDLCAWVLTPSGTTLWSGDDWHTWGWAEVRSAVNALPAWLETNSWQGLDVDANKILLVGHSNGGQGVWYGLSHHPTDIIAAAPLSGYLSIQLYVPTTFWRSSGPSKRAVVQSALSSFSHDLLASNFAGVPVFQQHGELDDNVPLYHSTLMHQLIAETASSSELNVMKERGHWWKSVATEPQLARFYDRMLRHPQALQLHDVDSFELVVADPGDATGRFGVRILYVQEQGKLGKLKVQYIKERQLWRFVPINVLAFEIPDIDAMQRIEIDAGMGVLTLVDMSHSAAVDGRRTVWSTRKGSTWTLSDPPYPPTRHHNHFGGLSAILRAEKTPFLINATVPDLLELAVQVSRNLNTYYWADTEIVASHRGYAAPVNGFHITLTVGDTLTSPVYALEFPLRTTTFDGMPRMQTRSADEQWRMFAPEQPQYSIFLRPKADGGLEIVVWGSDTSMAEQAARLLPLMTGTGQPDWILCTKEMMWKGLEGCELGWFDAWWQIQD